MQPVLRQPRVVVVTDETVAGLHLPRLAAGLDAGRPGTPNRGPAAGRADQGLPPFPEAGRGHPRARHRAPHHARRAGRRRRRRSHRLCRRDLVARPRLCADSHDAPRAGRQLRRRQDRDRHEIRQEPRRRLPSAGAGAGRHRRARDPAAARAAGGLCRGGEIRPHPRPRLLRLARGGRARSWSPAMRRAGARRCSRAAPPRPPWSPPTSARRASARCSISAIPSAMRSRSKPASAMRCCMARRWRWACGSPSIFRCGSGSARPRRRGACAVISPRSGFRSSSAGIANARPFAADALLAHMQPRQEGARRPYHADPRPRHRRGLHQPRRSGRGAARIPRGRDGKIAFPAGGRRLSTGAFNPRGVHPMPLSPPAPREPIHPRHVVCSGFRRADGLWDIEGHLTDVKSYDFDSRSRGTVAAGARRAPDVAPPDRRRRSGHPRRRGGDGSQPVPDLRRPSPCNFARLKGLSIRPGFL